MTAPQAPPRTAWSMKSAGGYASRSSGPLYSKGTSPGVMDSIGGRLLRRRSVFSAELRGSETGMR